VIGPGARDLRDLGTVLGVWAHPDDEAYLSAGVMAAAVDAGSRVVCVSATKGEAGSPDPHRCPPEAMARLREAELGACLAILGVSEHHWLGFPDGGCEAVDVGEAAAALAALIADVRPDTILTFGPEGFTDHADHKAVSGWVEAAHQLAVGADDRCVHFATQSDGWADGQLPRLVELGVFPPGFPPVTPADELSVDVRLSGPALDRKVAALRAQASQIEPLVDAIGLDLFRELFAVERFRPA
jgi:LmbE family N-acetylglucosaminyl deacetylase